MKRRIARALRRLANRLSPEVTVTLQVDTKPILEHLEERLDQFAPR